MHRIPVVFGKLSPPVLASDLVLRPRLTDRLARFARSGLILICAPAGYGKTTLMAQYGRQDGRPVAWFNLDPKDNDPIRLVAHLTAAFNVAGLLPDDLMEQSLKWLPSNLDQAWALLLNHLRRRGEPLLLMLDNTECIKASAACRQLDLLLRDSPPTLQIIMAGRGIPAVATAKLRADARLLELRTPDLALTADEIETLCKKANSSAGASEIYRLCTLTDGWITGLRLWLAARIDAAASEPVGGLTDDSVAHLAYRYIEDYFAQEVIRPLPGPVQQFLYRTSVVGRFDPAMAEILSGEPPGANRIGYLLRNNLFTRPAGSVEGWYQYHPMLQRSLYRHLARRDPEFLRSLHRRAADRLLQTGHYGEGLHQYGHSHDLATQLSVIEKYTFDILREGEVNEIVGSLAQIPATLAEEHFALAMTEASVVHVTKDIRRIKACLGRLQRLLRSTSPCAGHERLRNTSLYLRAHIAYLGGNPHYGIRLCDAELQRCNEGDAALSVLRFHRANCHYALGALRSAHRDAVQALSELQRYGITGYTNSICFLVGQIESSQGRTDLAEQRYQQLRPLPGHHAEPHNFYDIFYFLGMGSVRTEQNRLSSAEILLNRAASIALEFQPTAALPWVFHHLALLHCAKGDLERADQSWNEAQQVAYGHGLFGIYRLSGAWRARLALSGGGDDGVVERWLREWEAIRRRYGEDVLPEERLAHGWMQARRGCRHEAFRTCEQLISELKSQGNIPLLIDAHLLHCTLRRDNGENELALHALDQAVRLAADHRLPRLFFHEGRELVDLFRLGLSEKARRQQGLQTQLSHPDFVEDLLLAHQAQVCTAAPIPRLPFEQLTRREIDVLALVTEGRSNQEIADALYVGISTVKTHINSIFRKLESSTREEAIARARKLSLAA